MANAKSVKELFNEINKVKDTKNELSLVFDKGLGCYWLWQKGKGK